MAKKKHINKDGHTCGTCDAFSPAENEKRGHCRMYPPVASRNDKIDAYPLVQGDNMGCMMHLKRA